MPGLGKTTLANKLFNDPSIVYYFDKCAWCVVSQTYKKKNVLIDILTSIRNHNRETITEMEEEDLAEMLYKSLKGMRYLIVLDDVWDTRPWDDLRRYFPDDITGSRILFTSRNKELGFDNVVNELPILSGAECWELLQRKVFQTELCPPELQGIGQHIASRCHGLQISVIMISSILANMQKKESSWGEIARHLNAHIFDSTNNCVHILKLSYQHLSIHLKPCFLYFGVFEEDEVIPVQKLISLWVAEGFINKETHRSSEDVAHDYLMDLINRGLVLVAKERSNGGVKACMIHDLLHEICLRIAKEENFMGGIENGYSKCKKDKSRRVMDLSGPYWYSFIRYSFKDVRGGIENLVHLRYLKVQQKLKLPLIEKLHRLEYLHVENRDEVEIPDFVLNMKYLKCLHFGGGARFSESSHLRATTDGSFQINNLQSISPLLIHNEMDAKVLGCAPNLCKLKCKLFDLSWEKIRMIGRLPNIEVLKLRDGSFKEKQRDTEEGEFQKLKFFELNNVKIASQYACAEWNPISDDYPKLERLMLRNCYCLNKIPSSLGYSLTLQKIELYGCAESIEKSSVEIREEQQEMGNEELKVIIFHGQHWFSNRVNRA
ncbi:late blight resistance homolog R1A-3 [Olea europaea subsp. europaea]|uniref:Late blight resistance homolog R1A-3 n=1 Tax=Olea europaea subsp. europaea TaxID=158383 RepID=A0A8S0R7E8_OLEEU|nr:late blight resistance homolog R1A-3 [Olea europaea subsp. europaea]